MEKQFPILCAKYPRNMQAEHTCKSSIKLLFLGWWTRKKTDGSKTILATRPSSQTLEESLQHFRGGSSCHPYCSENDGPTGSSWLGCHDLLGFQVVPTGLKVNWKKKHSNHRQNRKTGEVSLLPWPSRSHFSSSLTPNACISRVCICIPRPVPLVVKTLQVPEEQRTKLCECV